LYHGARDCRLDRFPCSGVSVGERGRWRATQPGNAIGTGLTHMRRCCSSSKPAAAIAAGVSRAVWHPPNARPKHPVHSPLAERERRPVRQDVLVEAQLTAGAQHASQLGQRSGTVHRTRQATAASNDTSSTQEGHRRADCVPHPQVGATRAWSPPDAFASGWLVNPRVIGAKPSMNRKPAPRSRLGDCTSPTATSDLLRSTAALSVGACSGTDRC
jgi:hypothetical protein